MEVQFIDRILTCSDCHSEFVFTAGEQLFFHDKQFKNDPKRCKPCKSRRSGLSAGAGASGPAAAGLSRTETRTECSECGVPTTVPFKPTQGRPVLCRQCFQTKSKAIAAAPTVPMPIPVPASMPAMLASETASQLTAASIEPGGAMLSAESAVAAAASMAAASPLSSVASAADLASITELESASRLQIPTELLAAASVDAVPTEQIAARVEAAEA